MSDDYDSHVKSGALIKNFRETDLIQKYVSFLFHGKSEHKQTKKCTCRKNKELSCMFSAHL